MPLLMMLIAGAVTCVITFLREDTILIKLTVLFVVMLLFYLLGSILKWAMNYFDQQNAPKEEPLTEEQDEEQPEETNTMGK
jgi:Ca2+/Na+ antiporter